MSRDTAPPRTAQSFVELRRARILAGLVGEREPVGAHAEPLAPSSLAHLRRDAEELYWNELTWEELTSEEAITGGHLTELVFPGFLAFVEGLLVDRVPADALAPARPHPDAVEEILTFLGERYTETTQELENGADSQKLVWSRAMTSRLVDLVLYRLYRLTPAEQERVEAAR